MHTCPRDEVSLSSHTISGSAVRRCGVCSGLWLPSAVVTKAVGAVRRPESQSITSLRCPEDDQPLLALHHRGVEVDVCSACNGVWLDHGELERIVTKTSVAGAVADVALNAAADPGALSAIGDLAGDAIGAVFEFLGEALSGL